MADVKFLQCDICGCYVMPWSAAIKHGDARVSAIIVSNDYEKDSRTLMHLNHDGRGRELHFRFEVDDERGPEDVHLCPRCLINLLLDTARKIEKKTRDVIRFDLTERIVQQKTLAEGSRRFK